MTFKYRLYVTQDHSNWYYSKANWYGFPFAFHSNYGSILYRLRDKAKYWSKIGIFSYPLHSTPPSGGLRQNIAIPLGEEELEWCRCLMVKKFEDIFSRSDKLPACDGQTDWRTNILRRQSCPWVQFVQPNPTQPIPEWIFGPRTQPNPQPNRSHKNNNKPFGTRKTTI